MSNLPQYCWCNEVCGGSVVRCAYCDLKARFALAEASFKELDAILCKRESPHPPGTGRTRYPLEEDVVQLEERVSRIKELEQQSETRRQWAADATKVASDLIATNADLVEKNDKYKSQIKELEERVSQCICGDLDSLECGVGKIKIQNAKFREVLKDTPVALAQVEAELRGTSYDNCADVARALRRSISDLLTGQNP